jgi:hypothetical protein
MLNHPEAKDWYVAEVYQVLSDRITVNGYTTAEIPLAGYQQASRKLRADRSAIRNGIYLDILQRQRQRRGHERPSRLHIKKERRITCGNEDSQLERGTNCYWLEM